MKFLLKLYFLTGGQSVCFSSEPISIETIDSSSLEYIIIHDGTSASQNTDYNVIIEHIKKQGKRPIPLQEIAIAIISCSCEKDCNPNFDKLGTLIGKLIIKRQSNLFYQINILFTMQLALLYRVIINHKPILKILFLFMYNLQINNLSHENFFVTL